MNYHISLPLTCRFCGAETGHVSFDARRFPDGVTFAELGVGDVRCGACEETHGSYKEMHDMYLRDCGTFEEFDGVMQASGYDVNAFVAHLALTFPGRLEVLTDYPSILAARERAKT